jgi:iron complex outermembrane recepter protein
MKNLLLCVCIVCFAANLFAQKTLTFNDTSYLQPVEITAVKAQEKNPFAKTNLSKEDIKKVNIGQDLPFILNNTPSVVVNSDAGTGIGYTGIRIRGTDATRINVTLNGIPYNDAESLGTFFVDMPDIASSAGSIQVQRGVGTSANGAGSFGGSINVSTNELNKKNNLELNSAVGSFETFKNTLIYNSGIFGKHFTVDARMSNIRSQGYVDRASARLKSYFVSTAYTTEKSSVRLNVFTGKERTYQAYYGVNETALDTNRTYNSAGTEKPGSPYENQVDDYTQTHYQLFYNHSFNKNLKANIAVFLTRGKGYYEQYKALAKLSNYGLPNLGTIKKTDLTRRLWLDNYFYGNIFSLQYDKNNTQLIVGGGYNRYEGDHYGEIIWAKEQAAVPLNYRWYDNPAHKYDFSSYAKWTQKFGANIQTFADVQLRNINYSINGFRDNSAIKLDKDYFFVNPKAGITFNKKDFKIYASYGRAVKEPNRDDFEASITDLPKPEKLNDIESGIELNRTNVKLGANFYYMFYKDQLVLTGKINDVGAYTRSNIPKSYRSGVELFGSAALNKVFSLEGNITFSKNKVKNYTEYFDDYDNGGQKSIFYKEADISFSPDIISALSLNVNPIKNLTLNFTGKYVGNQFLDNTSNKNRMLHDYYTQDVKATYTLKGKQISEVNFYVQANNIFSRKYEPNGYTFSYIDQGKLTTENYYFPMSLSNFVVGINFKPNLFYKK